MAHLKKWPCILLLLSAGLWLPANVFARSSDNVPLWHWSYSLIDRLAGRGLIDGMLVGIKPFSRLEMARLTSEAMANGARWERDAVAQGMISRLRREFADELNTLGVTDGPVTESFVKPAEYLYFRFLYADKQPDLENRQGDVFSPQANYRMGFVSRAGLGEHVSFNLHPEFRYQEYGDGWGDDWELVEGYLKLDALKLELEAGRDSLWWGPGYHGALLMSSNAKPFDMLKLSTPQPVMLPWLLEYLGPFKAVSFLTKLEEDREDVPEPKLWGLRFDFKPHPDLEIGLSRVVMFGGRGRGKLGRRDYWDMFWANNENEPGRQNNNQLAGFDISWRISGVDKVLPLARSLTFYYDAAGEDMAGIFPSKWGRIWGLSIADFLLTGRTDIRVEYADNYIPGQPETWYRHGVYTSGYTYEGRVIGHHMGTDARDLFVGISHYLTPDLWLGLNFDREWRMLAGDAPEKRDYWEAEVNLLPANNLYLKADYRYERIENYQFVSTSIQNNNVIRVEAMYRF